MKIVIQDQKRKEALDLTHDSPQESKLQVEDQSQSVIGPKEFLWLWINLCYILEERKKWEKKRGNNKKKKEEVIKELYTLLKHIEWRQEYWDKIRANIKMVTEETGRMLLEEGQGGQGEDEGGQEQDEGG